MIYLIRHGETDNCHSSDKNNKNVSLNSSGIEQIHKLLPIIPDPTLILASPTIRTIESAHIMARGKNIVVEEPRLWNKSEDYHMNLTSLLQDLRTRHDGAHDIILLVTHGRIIKMIFSLITYGFIHKETMDELVLDYGDMFCVQNGSDDKFSMLWTSVKNDKTIDSKILDMNHH